MNLQNGGSLDVVCSSERKKSGSTLRPHQHPGRGKAVGGHRAPSLCPSEAAQPRLGYKHCSASSLSRDWPCLTIGTVKSHKRKWSNSSLTNGRGRTQVSETVVTELRSLTNGTVKSHNGTVKSHKRNLLISQTVVARRPGEVSQTVVSELRSLTNGSVRTQVSETEVTNCEVSQTNSSLSVKEV